MKIQLAHGGGGRLNGELIRDEIVSRFGADVLQGLPDAASLSFPLPANLVFSTDSYVVNPWEFPGGNIGHLAVHGTVNDLSVAGGKARFLSLAMIIEEGLPLTDLRKILDAVKSAADNCGVLIVTGDTKVVGRGQCDKIYLNTAGLGERFPEFKLSRQDIVAGDAVLVSGTVGDHGLAVMAVREGIGISGELCSDTGPVHRLVDDLRQFGEDIRFMRDPTRGGVAAVLNELVEGLPVGIILRESDVPIAGATGSLAEMLGLDVLNVACEGRMLAICSPAVADQVLSVWRRRSEGSGAALIGTVSDNHAGRVVLETLSGGSRLVDVPMGEMLPRIC